MMTNIEWELAPADLAAQGIRTVATRHCGCHACDEGVQAGHFACAQPTSWMLELERAGIIGRLLHGSTWYWIKLRY